MSNLGQVDADLMRPPCDEVNLEEGPASETLAYSVPCRRGPTANNDRHPLSL
jgi:hypothetical protein